MQTVLNLAYHKDLKDKNNLRIKEQEKQYQYYAGNAHELKLFLITALEKTYKPDDVKDMQLQWVNITKKIVDQMSIVYLEPAQRKLMKDDDTDDDLTKYYNDLMPIDMNNSDKRAHRLAKLHNTSLTQVMFDKHTGKFRYKTLPSYLYQIKYDGDRLTEVSYDKYFHDSGEDILYTVVWTDETLLRRDALGNESTLPDKDDTENPFGVLPFSFLRLKESIDFWGEGESDVVNVNEQVNLLLTKLINRDIILGTEGTTITTNLGLNKKGDIKDGRREIRIGVGHPINVEGVKSDDVLPSIQHIGFDPHIVEVKETIDWYIRTIANFNGLNPSNILSEIKDTSDYQKVMDAVEQMEIRKDDIEPCRIYEHNRFNITRIVNNKFVGTETGRQYKLKEIPEDTEFMVDFADIEIHLTPKDQRDDWDWKLKNNLITLKDILKKQNPDLNDEQITEQLENNKLLNSKLGGRMGMFELLTEGQSQ